MEKDKVYRILCSNKSSYPDRSIGYLDDKLVLIVRIHELGEEQSPVVLHFFSKDLKISVLLCKLISKLDDILPPSETACP